MKSIVTSRRALLLASTKGAMQTRQLDFPEEPLGQASALQATIGRYARPDQDGACTCLPMMSPPRSMRAFLAI